MPDYYSNYTGQQIDASVGEVVNAGGAVSARLMGNGKPTSTTAARVGDLYTDTSTGGKMYRCIRVNGSTYTWDVVGSGGGEGTGDMTKAVYDTNNNGIVDNAEKLGGNLPEYYAASDDIPTKTSDLTNDSGFVTDEDIPEPYTLPIASSSALGGIKADAKQSGDTQAVRVDANGKLWTAPGGGGGSAFVPYNVNLLDNADWFAYVVNQRGSTSYSGLSYSYGIDRWIITGDIEITSPTDSAEGYITISSGCTMKQRMEILPSVLAEKTVTAAIDIDGTVYSGMTRFPGGAGEHTLVDQAGVAVKIGIDSGTYELCGVSVSGCPYIKIIASADVNVRRVWLELGDVCHMETTPPKNYTENLTACQRYYYRIDLNGLAVLPLANGQVVNASTARVVLPTPVEMRIKPEYRSDAVAEIRANGVLYSSVSAAVYNTYRNLVALTLTRTGGDNFPTNHLTALGVHASAAGENAYFELRADL